MAKEIISLNREFQIWSYNVSHGLLLLRSAKSKNVATRFDILFTDVRGIELRAKLFLYVLYEMAADEVMERSIKPAETLECGLKIFYLNSSGWVGCIIAGGVRWQEDDGEYGQPSGLLK